MLSEDTIDNLVQILIDREEEMNLYVLRLIAARIKDINSLLPSDINRLEQLYRTGSDVRKINNYLSTATGLQVAEIKRIIQQVALSSYQDAKPFYDYRKKAFIPFAKNKTLQKLVRAVANITSGTYKNLSKSRAFMLRNPKAPKQLIPMPPAKIYQKVVDSAINNVVSGVVDKQSAMRETLKILSEKGMQYVVYQSEKEADEGKVHWQSAYAAVNRNMNDGIRSVNQEVQNLTGREYGADGVELSVHRYSAPDHEPIQGHQFSIEEFNKLQNNQRFTDFNGKTFQPLKRVIGQYNCRHFAWNIILGEATPNYTDEQLEKFKEENAKGFTDSTGKHRTMYECTQHQRELERKIRNLKTAHTVAREAGDEELAKQYQRKIGEKLREYDSFSKATNLKTRPERIRISSYKKI